LSAESASGQFPVETVGAMVRICREAEKSAHVKLDREFLDRIFTRVDQSIAMAALFTAHHLKVKCIAALTQSGSTALWMSRLNSGVPIYALTPEAATLTKCALMRDVRPFTLAYEGHDREKLMRAAEKVLLDHRVVENGDLVVITIGEPIGQSGGTNTMKIVRIGEHRSA
ncbi:MAG: pyruvate kinase, partial [Betaproteobacteria bacterium]|nr:pyruvate kinase [Betaproteobacteria bacterium]